MELINFPPAEEPKRNVFEISAFKGIDLTSSPTDVDAKRSPDAVNMMPDNRGNPIKRPGFGLIKNYGARINGRFTVGGHEVIHAGTTLYIDGHATYSGMADRLSTGQVIGNKLYIFDGEEAIVCDGEDAYELFYDAYIPTVLISKNADFYIEGGETITQEPGGSKHEAFNLISDQWSESFLCPTGTETTFTLSEKGLSKRTVKAKVMDENGTWQEKFENVDFTVNRETGKVTFLAAVPAAAVTGEDNVIITAAKHFVGYADKINHCRQSIAYGENGIINRIFLCGNPCEGNKDFWCAVNDPTYWPDTYYSVLGNEDTKIIGYSIIDGKLATHLSPAYDGRSILLRHSSLAEDGTVSFPVTGFLQGEEATAPGAFVYMETEPLFLTKRGVYAITPEDIDGRFYNQNRSYFINKAITAENGLTEAVAAKWKQFYCLALSEKLYLLDTSQKSYAKGEPLSSFQYECYLWNGFTARTLWEDEDGALCFGGDDGNVCRFATNLAATASYEDYHPGGNVGINAYWTTADFSGGTFWRNKTIRVVALQAAAYPQNKVKLEKCVNGIWSLIKEWDAKISFFGWSALKWSAFTWSGNSGYRTIAQKVKIKKFDRVSFRIGCADIGKAFGIYGFSVEYSESGRYKK